MAVEYRFAEGQFDRLPALGRADPSPPASGRNHCWQHRGTRRKTSDYDDSNRLRRRRRPRRGQPRAQPQLTWAAAISPASTNSPRLGSRESAWGCCAELVPTATIMATLINPNFSAAENPVARRAAGSGEPGCAALVVRANVANDFYTAFASVVQQRADALLVGGSPFFNGRRQQRQRTGGATGACPRSMNGASSRSGGRGPDELRDQPDRRLSAGRRADAGRILKGEKPADTAGVQLTRFEFVVNPEYREDYRPRSACSALGAGRRGDRVSHYNDAHRCSA